MHPAYKHLTDRLKIAELTIPQISALFCGLMSGLLFALYLSPFSPYLTLCLSIYVACVPAGTVVLATSTEFDLWLYAKACVGELFSDGQYAAGPGDQFTGYTINPDESDGRSFGSQAPPADLGELWAL